MKRILLVIIVVLLVFSCGYYIYEVAVQGASPTENLGRLIVVLLSCLIALNRIRQSGIGQRAERKPLSFYEKHFWQQLEHVYSRDAKSRKKLLEAVRYFDEDKFAPALKILENLKKARPAKREFNCLCLFSALCYTDWGLTDAAIKEYETILITEPNHVTALGNLGLIYSKNGDYSAAEKYLIASIAADPNYAYGYNNLAYVYYRTGDFGVAMEYAHKTIEIQSNFRQSLTLLAILYFAKGDEENYKKYRELAVINGESGEVIDDIASELKERYEEEDSEYED